MVYVKQFMKTLNSGTHVCRPFSLKLTILFISLVLNCGFFGFHPPVKRSKSEVLIIK